MGERIVSTRWGRRLLAKISCPNCRHAFRPEDALFIALQGDAVDDVVREERRRFAPERFNVKGEALDPSGFPTSAMACPRCHLPVPPGMLELPPIFVSLVGSAASGKSYFLTTMAWQLRHAMPRFHVAFSDADPALNGNLHRDEQILFLSNDPDRPTEIQKTQQDDSLRHVSVTINEATVRYVRPLQFVLWPTAGHPEFHRAGHAGCMLVLYDNAGEDYRPGTDESGSTVTEHLSRSNALFMLFDLSQDRRFLELLSPGSLSPAQGLRPGMNGPDTLDRQEPIFRNTALRIRRYLGLPHEKPINKPLIVILPKFDLWARCAGVDLDEEPIRFIENGSAAVDLHRIEQTSQVLKNWIARIAPEVAATLVSINPDLRFVPVSSLGVSPELIAPKGGAPFYGIRPRQVSPKWVTVPLLYCLARWRGQLVPTLGQGASEEPAS